MAYNSLKDFLIKLPGKKLGKILDDKFPVKICGLDASSPAFLIAKTYLETKKPILVLCHSQKSAENMQSDLEGFLEKELIKYFPHRENTAYDGQAPFGHTVEIRTDALATLTEKTPCIVVSSIYAAMQKIISPKEFTSNIIRLERYQQIEMETLINWLNQMGFVNSSVVEDIGQFSVRGGILDVFPFMTDHPFRIEFWGNEIESIREFDVFSQRSYKKLDVVKIYSMQEFVVDDKEKEFAIDQIKNKLGNTKEVEKFEEKIILEGNNNAIEWYIGWFKQSFGTIIDYLEPQSFIFNIQNAQDWQSEFNGIYQLYTQNYAKAISHGYNIFSPPDELLWEKEELSKKLNSNKFIEISYLNDPNADFSFSVKEQPKYISAISSFAEDVRSMHQKGFEVCVLCDNKGQAKRLEEMLEEEISDLPLLIGSISKGFSIEEFKIALFTDHQIFNRYARKIKYRKYKGGVSIPSLSALSNGDFVVHQDHGIGIFSGVQRIKAGEDVRDCMLILFKNNDKVFVPVEDFEKIQKYVGKEGTPPALSSLGSKTWEKTKSKTKKAIEQMAKDLMELYAKRKFIPGYSFSPDTSWQKEFEDAFIYEPTDDQKRAISDIKTDMEKPNPMDRLVCGDVGFGKTEVAIRAVFKCVTEGKQAAVLVPTTLLASQHYQSFKERFADFPVKIGLLSRFVSSKQIKDTVKRIANKEIDVIIGTHRLLSKDIVFKDLGLLVVDEEHRFGVRHKEKIKQISSNIDVISMTATPIPRTLHMSMVGARDISIIGTPPLNRLPIQTRVMEFSEEKIQEAIEHELSREGQIYIVHNRVKSINKFAEIIERLAPKARIAVAHGQMNEKDLEKIMQDFTDGHFDILVSTMIIESGLDIQNVNTLIVNRADMFGLANLYQLRGRVGRSSVQAYAYLLTPSFASLKPDALRRLKTLEQFTDLGSGFQIAMRDMEIRGAGNIIGTRQHGFIFAVGFEMYMRILKDCMSELKGEKKNIEIDPKITAQAEAYLPESYIEDPQLRVTLYQRLSKAENHEKLKEYIQELTDRFGEPPREARSLIAIMSIKVTAKKYLFYRVTIGTDNIILEFSPEHEPKPKELSLLMEKIKRKFEIVYESPIKINIELSETDNYLKLQQAKILMEEMI